MEQTALDLWLANKNKKKELGIQPMPKDTFAPLSHGQQRLWLLQKLYPDNPFYQYAHAYRFVGELNLDALFASFQMLAQRHTVLLSNYLEKDGQVLQIPNTKRQIPIEVIDLRGLTLEKQEQQLKVVTLQNASKTFDLSKDVLLRITVCILSEKDFSVMMSMHHIAGDRWSLQILHEEVATTYREMIGGENTNISPLEIQYKDYAYWQNQQEIKSTSLAFWKEHLKGDLPILDLPNDFARPVTPSFAGKSSTHIYPKQLSHDLKLLARELQVTPFVLLLAAYQVLLSRFTGQEDIITGTPFTNRDKAVLEKLIGFFNETLVLRADLSGEPTFRDFVAQIHKTTTAAFLHKNVPFETLVRTLNPERNGLGNPLFQTMFLYNSIQKLPVFSDNLHVEESIVDLGVSKFDLTLFVTDKGEQLNATFEYSTDLFKAETIENLHNCLRTLLSAIVQDPNQKISEIPLLTLVEREKILNIWNKRIQPDNSNQNILKAFQKQVIKNPHAPCVVANNICLTYGEVNSQADAMAGVLQNQGVSSATVVGLHLSRSTQLLIGIIGVLKAGAAYLPLDPDYPTERIIFMLNDAEVKVIVSEQNLSQKLPEHSSKIIQIEKAITEGSSVGFLAPRITNDQLAYIIYTSGSTGQPKGVPITHANLWHSTNARFSYYDRPANSFLLLSSFAFDSSVAGIFWTIAQGGKLVIPPKRIEQDVTQLSEIIAREKVTHTLLLPSLYAVLLQHSDISKLHSLNTVMVAGEACTPKVVALHFAKLADVRFYNEYGPTEATVWSTVHEILPKDATGLVPIGKPIRGVQNYILDKKQQLVPVGVMGELYIGGRGLAKAYLNRPKLSAERFVDVQLAGNKIESLYRTGDTVRYRHDGVIEYLGRVDRQVKIRGYRIEPDEIQAVLQQQKGIEEAIIRVDETGAQKRLIAYFTENTKIEIADLRQNLKNILPAYMIPAIFIGLEEFPRLPNGKINHKQLINIPIGNLSVNENFIAPNNNIEAKIAAVWEEILEVKPIGRHDNFFDIGGDSILSIRIVAELREIGFKLAANQLFQKQTIAELASDLLKNKDDESKINVPSIDLSLSNYALSFMQQAFLLHHLQNEKDQGFLQLEFTINGDIDCEKWEKAWQFTAERHAALRTRIDANTSVQTIEETKKLKWNYYNFSGFTENKKNEKVKYVLLNERDQKLNFNEAPISRFHLITTENTKHLLIWSCHHILLDGWSGGLILQDALEFYRKIKNQTKISVKNLPTYPAFLKNQTLHTSEKERIFWNEYFRDFKTPTLFPKNSNQADFVNIKFSLNTTESLQLRQFAQKYRITLNTILKGAWSLLLKNAMNTDEVSFGTTVSGRNASFPQIDKMSGLFMNVLPTRVKFPTDAKLPVWLQELQTQEIAKGAFDQSNLQDIITYAGFAKHQSLFDTLFVYGNFMKDDLTIGDLTISDFKGDFTSVYPLTLRVNPIEALEFDLRYDRVILSEESSYKLKQDFLYLLNSFIQETIDFSKLSFHNAPLKFIAKESSLSQEERLETYLAPRTSAERELVKIWEQIFQINPIGRQDNFFDLGGNSLLAMQLFAEIEDKTGKILPPNLLMTHSSIEQLASKLNDNEVDKMASETIVPLRASGSRTPLFCIHAGGAHVFFYQALAKYLNVEQPVYAIQPQGLDGSGTYHGTIEEMAEHYVAEIQKVQPNGPYHLLGTCFSNAVCLEMAKQLDALGCEVSMIIVDSAPAHLIPLEESKPIRRFLRILLEMNWSLMYRKLRRRALIWKKKIKPKPMSAAQKQLQETINSLNALYAAYRWTPFAGKISLIRSTQFAQNQGKHFHLKQWKSLARGGLEIYITEARHLTIFKEPDVRGLAKKVEQCLDA